MRPPIRYVICDVFTDRVLTGNQLAVFTDARALDTELMQALAREMGFSESTFILRPEAGGHARVRIWTPGRELPFAGHPTPGPPSSSASPHSSTKSGSRRESAWCRCAWNAKARASCSAG